jgi:hypothetical protein
LERIQNAAGFAIQDMANVHQLVHLVLWNKFFFALAWILTAEKLKPELIAPVGLVMTLENLIALVPTWTMGSYTRSIRNRAINIAAASPEAPTVEATHSILGNQIMDRTLGAILVGLVLLSICWIYVIILGWADFRARCFR